MLENLKEFIHNRFKRKVQKAEVNLQVISALCDVYRPMLRREDIERIDKTHQDLQEDIRTTRDQARDIAVRLSSELERARLKVSIISDSIMDPVLSVDSQSVILSANKFAEDVLGWHQDVLVGMDLGTIIGPEYRKKFSNEALAYTRHLRECKPTDLTSIRDIYRDYVNGSKLLSKTHSVKCLTGDGSKIVTEMYINILNVDNSDKDNVVFIVIVKDVSQKAATNTEVESLSRLQTSLLAALPNPVFYKDEDLLFFGGNDAFYRFTNLPSAKIFGKSNADIFPPKLAADLDRIEKSLKEDTSVTPDVQIHKLEFKTLTSKPREVILYGTTLRSNGEFKGVLATLVDVTDLMYITRFKDAILNNIPTAVYYLDAELKYKGCNEQYCTLVGLPSSYILGKSRESVVSYKLRNTNVLHEFYRQKDADLLSGTQTYQSYESQVYNHSLKTVLDVVVYRSVITKADGSFDGIVALVTDISEIRSMRRFHQLVFDSSPIPVFYKDKYLRYVACNSLYATWLGLEKAEIIGKTREELFHLIKTKNPNLKDFIDREYRRIVEKHSQNEQRLLNNKSQVVLFDQSVWHFSEGEYKNVVFYNHVLSGDGGFEGVICSILDVTDLKNVQHSLDSIPVPVCTFDNGLVIDCNNRFAKMVGLNRSQIFEVSIDDPNLKEYFNFDHRMDVTSKSNDKEPTVYSCLAFDSVSNRTLKVVVYKLESKPNVNLYFTIEEPS